jgi:16S rRNA (uracil1498-N3)-methyltransferase
MADAGGKIRLFVDAPLAADGRVRLAPQQMHYLLTVMRLAEGDPVLVFNGRDGEWQASISGEGRGASLEIAEQVRPQQRPQDLWLLFAPLRRARTDLVVEKATELGTAVIRPVFTRLTNAERVRADRLRRIAIEAAEQCGETHLPEIAEPQRLERLLDAWPGERRLIFCDEARLAPPAARSLMDAPRGPAAILIGPEGGFTAEEAERLRSLPFVLPVSLGPRILRAETAAIAALALWQSLLGDWT